MVISPVTGLERKLVIRAGTRGRYNPQELPIIHSTEQVNA
jgi:hypothetical protein